MSGLSPDDYRRAAGYRRSEAAPRQVAPVPVRAYTTWDMTDPALLDFLRDGRVTAAGISVNEMTALRNSTMFRAIHLIAGAIGMLPTHLMRRSDDGTIEKARDHPLFGVLHRKPNAFQTPFEFKSWMQSCALLDGNAYGLIIRSRGAVRAIVPLRRKAVKPKLSDSFELTFEYRRPNGGMVTLQPGDVFHFRHPVSRDGLNGLSLLDVAADSLGLASQAERAAGRVFSKGAMVGGALESDKTLGPDAMKNLKESMEVRHSGADNAGSWMILEDGLKAKVLGSSAKDAQNLETRKMQAEEMARFTGAPRPLLMFDETSWGSGIEQLGLMFVTYCLMPWFVAWEQAIQRSCLTDAEQDTLYVKFNEGALLRGSLKDQAEFFAKALGAGGSGAYRTPNEVREAFDMNPLDGGDSLPAMTSAGAPAPSDPNDDPSVPPKPKQKVPADD